MPERIDSLATHIHLVLAKPTCGGWTDIRNNLFPHSLYWIHEGQGVFTAEDGTEFPVESGMLTYLKPGFPLFMRSDSRYPMRMTMILFECAEYEYSGSQWGSLRRLESLSLPFLSRYAPGRSMELSALFRSMEELWVPGSPEAEARVKSVLLRLLAETRTTLTEGENGGAGQKSDRIRDLKTYMEKYYHTDLRVGELAESFGLSAAYLRKTFAEAYGCSPKDYLIGLRNEHAIRYLLYTDEPVEQIAKACGYPDIYHFGKMFKLRNGISPVRFRGTRGSRGGTSS